jgi:hypothetical protein
MIRIRSEIRYNSKYEFAFGFSKFMGYRSAYGSYKFLMDLHLDPSESDSNLIH